MNRFLLMETVMIASPASQPGMLIPAPQSTSAAAAAADIPASTPSYISSGSHFSPSMIIIFVVLLSAFFFMGFFAVYVRRCTSEVEDFSTSWRGRSRQRIFGNPAAVSANVTGSGIDPSQVETFPMVSYASVKRKGCNECVVCLADFDTSDMLRQLPKCKHVFHPACIGMWLESHSTCPLCRRNLLGSDKWSVSFRWGGSGSSRYAGSRSGHGDREGSNSVSLRSARLSTSVEEPADRREVQLDAAAAAGAGAKPTIPATAAAKRWRRLQRSYSTGNSLLRGALHRAASQVGTVPGGSLFSTPPRREAAPAPVVVVIAPAAEMAELPLRRTRSMQELDDCAGSGRQPPLL